MLAGCEADGTMYPNGGNWTEMCYWQTCVYGTPVTLHMKDSCKTALTATASVLGILVFLVIIVVAYFCCRTAKKGKSQNGKPVVYVNMAKEELLIKE